MPRSGHESKLLKKHLGFLIRCNKMITKTVVLDVDGVIFRHPPTLQKVYKRIQAYVSKTSGSPIEHSERVNEIMYSHFGHTFIGLQKFYNKKLDFQSFNDYVYTEDIVNTVMHSIYNVDALHHLIDLQQFLKTCSMQNIPVYMFSNAPHRWCQQVQKSSNLSLWIPDDHIISCDHDVFQSSKQQSLKPQPAVYKTLQDYLSHRHNSNDVEIVFVDDSLTNLIPVLDAPRWRPVLFSDKYPSLESYKLRQIASFKDFLV